MAQEMGSALEDALTMRYVLEVGAAEAAAQRTLTDHDRNHLEQRLKEDAHAGIVAGDAEGARRAAAEHLSATGSLLRGLLE